MSDADGGFARRKNRRGTNGTPVPFPDTANPPLRDSDSRPVHPISNHTICNGV